MKKHLVLFLNVEFMHEANIRNRYNYVTIKKGSIKNIQIRHTVATHDLPLTEFG
jgi:hypothetical protein